MTDETLTEAEWEALLGSWSCDYCEPEKRGLRKEFDALLASRLAAVGATRDYWQRQAEGFLRAATNELGRYHREKDARHVAEAEVFALRERLARVEAGECAETLAYVDMDDS